LHGHIISLRVEVWTHKLAYPRHLYWWVCTKTGKWEIILLYAKATCINFVSVFYDLPVGFWNCVVFSYMMENKVLIIYQICLFLTLIDMFHWVIFIVCLIMIHLTQSESFYYFTLIIFPLWRMTSNYISFNQTHPLRNPQSKQGLVNFISCLTRSNYFSFNQAHPLLYSQMKQEYVFFHYLSYKIELL
jgi:hypothetical protein